MVVVPFTVYAEFAVVHTPVAALFTIAVSVTVACVSATDVAVIA